MSSTDVPNGVLFVGQKGHVALVDLNEKGVMAEQVERHRNTHWLVIAPALRQGREVYHL